MSGRARKVILIEDDRDVRNVLRLALEEEDLEVEAFADGGPALANADFSGADLVVTDLCMPTPGDFVIREVRRQGHRVPIVVITGTVGDLGESGLVAAGATAVLRKPLCFDELGLILASLLPPSRPAA